MDNYSRGKKDPLYDELTSRNNVHHLTADLSEKGSYDELPDEVDTIYHMAALNGTQNFYERPHQVLKSTTLPTFYLIEKYFPTERLDRFVYAGSSEAYASTVTEFDWPVPTSEDVPLSISDPSNERWSYGASKLHGEVLTIQAAREHEVPYSILRYHNAYGPRMGDNHVIPDFVDRMKDGKYVLYGYKNTRSFIYIDDAVRATIGLAREPEAANETVNVGGGKEIKILDLAEKIMELAGEEGDIELNPSPEGSVMRRAPSIDKLEALIDFQIEWPLEKGLSKTLDYYLDR